MSASHSIACSTKGWSVGTCNEKDWEVPPDHSYQAAYTFSAFTV